MNRFITYGIERETGIVVSRVGREVAYPVLDFEAIGQGGDGCAPGDFSGPSRWNLEKMSVYAIDYPSIRWTKGFGNTHGTPPVPLELKNRHRVFWGFKPLRDRAPAAT